MEKYANQFKQQPVTEVNKSGDGSFVVKCENFGELQRFLEWKKLSTTTVLTEEQLQKEAEKEYPEGRNENGDRDYDCYRRREGYIQGRKMSLQLTQQERRDIAEKAIRYF